MTSDLEQRLREALHEDAERARLVNPNRPVAPEARPLPGAPHQRRSVRKPVAVAAAVVLFVAAGVAVAQVRDRGHEVSTVPGPTRVFTDVPPGATVELPRAPVSANVPGLVWSGTEMIVWGGMENGRSVGDGAAFNLATGTWRVIAPAPIEDRAYAQAVWTGTEMIVVGGLQRSDGGDKYLRDGGAYNPTTDTWRRLPKAPIEFGDGLVPVWTGEEVVALGDGAAAYSPETNEWRRLADPPEGSSASMVWTGETILMPIETPELAIQIEDDPSSLVRYDLDADEWQTVDDEGYTALAPVPDAHGGVGSVLALPDRLGAPVAVLDRAGNAIGTLPGFPGDRAEFGDRIYAVPDRSRWLGEEALFWISSADSGVKGGSEPWTLNPDNGTWRQLEGNAPSLGVHLELVDDAGVLVGWGPRIHDVEVGSSGVVYRPPAPADDIGDQPVEATEPAEPTEDPLSLPEPGDQPADAAAAEAQVRAAYIGIFDFSQPREGRAQLSERPGVWSAANQALVEGPSGAAVRDLHAQVDEVVFTSPTRAAVRFQLIATDPSVPRDQLGDAVLVDGRWLVAVTTTCRLVQIAGVQCDMSL